MLEICKASVQVVAIMITYPDGLQVSYTYNGLNLPVSVSDSVYSATISYDEAGNRLQEVLPNGITGVRNAAPWRLTTATVIV